MERERRALLLRAMLNALVGTVTTCLFVVFFNTVNSLVLVLAGRRNDGALSRLGARPNLVSAFFVLLRRGILSHRLVFNAA